MPAGVADRRRVHAGRLPELALGAPEAAHAEHRRCMPVGERRRDAVAVDEVRVADRHRRRAAGQRLVGRRHAELLRGEEHGVPVYGAPRAIGYRRIGGMASRSSASAAACARPRSTARCSRAVGELLPAGTTLHDLRRPRRAADLQQRSRGSRAGRSRSRRAIAAADGVVFAVPEYNYSDPGRAQERARLGVAPARDLADARQADRPRRRGDRDERHDPRADPPAPDARLQRLAVPEPARGADPARARAVRCRRAADRRVDAQLLLERFGVAMVAFVERTAQRYRNESW